MATPTRTQRRYDHRLREHVRTTRDIDCVLQHAVPRSTARVPKLNRDQIMIRSYVGGLLKSFERKAA